MNRRSFTLVTAVLLLLLAVAALAACAQEPAAPPATEVVEVAPTEVIEPTAVPPTEEPTPEPTAVPTEVPIVAAEPEAINAGFETFLADMAGYNTITVEDLNLALAEDPPPFLLDVREMAEVEENGYIEGAVVIPLRELADNLQYLPSFDTPIVSYCGSGWRCTIALTALEGMGWQDVRGLKDGSFGGWKDAGYPVMEGTPPEPMALNAAEPDPSLVLAMQEMLQAVPEGYGVVTAEDLNIELAEEPDLILIDVRRPEEVEEQGYIDAANVLFIPLEEFVAQQDMWPTDTDAPIVVYCGSGHRSTIAMTILWANGYTDVRSLKGGYGGWVASGYPAVGAPTAATALDEAFATFLGDMEAYNTIGLEDLNIALGEDPPPFLLDVRSPNELEEGGYIEGTVNIPLRELADNLQYLPSFDTPIVSYCGSGWRCTIALTALEALGWEDVRGLKGGSFAGWVEAGFPVVEGLPPEPVELNAAEPDPALVAAMQEMLQAVPEGFGVIKVEDLNLELAENSELVVIDVRTPEEIAEKGAIDAENLQFIPLEEFIAQQELWPADKDTPIVVYCGSGHRSTIAMTILWSYGYTDVRSLQGGFAAWADADLPTIAPEDIVTDPTAGAPTDLDAAFTTFLDGMTAYNTIGLDDLNLALAEDPPPFLLDVREPGELEEKGHIEGAVNIPLRELADNIAYLPSFDTPIVSYCGSGWRCTIALTALEALGWQDVRGLKGGSFGGWVEGGYPVVEGAAAEPLELNVAEPDPALVAVMADMLQTVPEGFGGISVDDLNLALAENPDLIVIDVRTQEELVENGVIPAENWIHIPLEAFIAQMDQWPADKDAPIVIYCGSGHRSTIAMTILWSYGYSDVQSMQGGFAAWADAGYPVEEYAQP
jgi:rhodanese-related sulfurtransferase